MWHAWERVQKCAKFWWGSPKERDHSEYQGVEGMMVSERILGRLAEGGGLYWIRLELCHQLYAYITSSSGT
jgi:hypothetical protein